MSSNEAAARITRGGQPPLLSIGLPVCNGENYLARALDSILAQDFEDFELIICDNASGDRTAEICQDYQDRDSRIRYYRNAENIGAAPNFNRCLELARGELFKWAAHDDLLAPGYLRRCVDTLLAQPNAVLCHSLVTIIDGDDRPIATYDSELIGAASARVDERLAALILNRHLCTDMFGVMRTAALRSSQQHGAYYGGDRAMLAEMSLLGRFLKVPEPLFLNREHPDRFVRAVAPRQWQSWHSGSAVGSMANPTWRLFQDYREAVTRHVRDPAELRRCQSVLRHWWLVDWNIGRLLIDVCGQAVPQIHGVVRWLKLQLFGKLPQVREQADGQRQRDSAAPRRKVIYIGGWGRSGSSLLANILGSSPKAVSVGELRYLWDRGMVENKLCGCGEAFDSCQYWSTVLNHASLSANPETGRRYAERVGSDATLSQLIAMLTAGGRRYRRRRFEETAILDSLYNSIGAVADADIIIDASKTPPYALNLLTNENVDLYFIHLIRDPRAVAYSWSRKRASKEAADEMLPRYSGLKSGLYWAGFNLLGLLFRWRRRANYLAVRYEDFCNEPRSTVADIFDHCGIGDPELQWYSDQEVDVSMQHSISGNPSRFNVGRVTIKPDIAWQTRMATTPRWIVTLLCVSLFPVFGYKIRQSHRETQPPTGSDEVTQH